MDARSTVKYSTMANIEDGVVNSRPSCASGSLTMHSPSPLFKLRCIPVGAMRSPSPSSSELKATKSPQRILYGSIQCSPIQTKVPIARTCMGLVRNVQRVSLNTMNTKKTLSVYVEGVYECKKCLLALHALSKPGGAISELNAPNPYVCPWLDRGQADYDSHTFVWSYILTCEMWKSSKEPSKLQSFQRFSKVQMPWRYSRRDEIMHAMEKLKCMSSISQGRVVFKIFTF